LFTQSKKRLKYRDYQSEDHHHHSVEQQAQRNDVEHGSDQGDAPPWLTPSTPDETGERTEEKADRHP
jgi:hypothetical protein